MSPTPTRRRTPLPGRAAIELDKTAGDRRRRRQRRGRGRHDHLHVHGDQHRQRDAEPGHGHRHQGRCGHLPAPAPWRPAASATCTAGYTSPRPTWTAGTVDNTATAHGHPADRPRGHRHRRGHHPGARPCPTITLVKTAGALTDGDGNGPDAGDTISLLVQGDQHRQRAADPVTVTDPKVGPVTCPTGALAPDAHVTCTASGVHADPGRRRPRPGRQHRDRPGHAADRCRGHRRRLDHDPGHRRARRSASTRPARRSTT